MLKLLIGLIKLLTGLIIIAGVSFWLYQKLDTPNSAQEQTKPTPKTQQKLNREKRNPYFQ